MDVSKMMCNFRRISILFFLTILICTAISKDASAGEWAAAGRSPFVSLQSPLKDIPAPSGMVLIRGTDDGLLVISGKNRTLLQDVLATPSITEVLWAPDSKAFIVNASDGGVVGTWKAYFYSLDSEGRPITRNLDGLIVPLIRKFPRCDPPEPANIGVSAWLKGSKELLVVVEVPPHSDCRNMGSLLGFRVSIATWKVVERMSETRLRGTWGRFLGDRFVQSMVQSKLIY